MSAAPGMCSVPRPICNVAPSSIRSATRAAIATSTAPPGAKLEVGRRLPGAVHALPAVARLHDLVTLEAQQVRHLGPHPGFVVDHENYFIEYVTRVINTNAEAHNHWYDYIHVLEGEGSITYGGTQEGATDAGAGEMRGGRRSVSARS